MVQSDHYSDVIMGAFASQITSLTIVYSTVHSGADQRKHQNSASLAFVRGIHRWPVNSPRKWPVTRKMYPFDDVIMWYSLVKTHQRDSLFTLISTEQAINTLASCGRLIFMRERVVFSPFCLVWVLIKLTVVSGSDITGSDSLLPKPMTRTFQILGRFCHKRSMY